MSMVAGSKNLVKYFYVNTNKEKRSNLNLRSTTTCFKLELQIL